MELTVCNPQKGRLETIDLEFTENNTTYFDMCETSDEDDIEKITDMDGNLVI